MTNDEQIDELRRLHFEATPGEWNDIGGSIFCQGADDACRGCFILWDRMDYKGAKCNRDADTKLVSLLRNMAASIINESGRTDALMMAGFAASSENQRLINLVRAVKASEFNGIHCNDVDGKNWFDAAEECLKNHER